MKLEIMPVRKRIWKTVEEKENLKRELLSVLKRENRLPEGERDETRTVGTETDAVPPA